jgi:HSP20 family protein
MTRYGTDIQALRHGMNRLFDRSGNANGDVPLVDETSGPRVWAPAVDVSETEREIVLHAELPGLRREDIDIQLTGDTLTLRGERQLPHVAHGENYHRIERQYGVFARTFQIEMPIEIGAVSASYEEGVLTVRLPKQELLKSRRIDIQVK